MQHIFYEFKIVDVLVVCTNKLIQTKGKEKGEEIEKVLRRI